ncbi:phosphatidylinositol-3,4,5-trisphosphate 3-phosphatase [Thraustotheca clavata]|uniref:Phosphatidylinositol-3,4,5-trisphosphate 3-phosphatase n=1 Tax=Thraustotheca clavata TaxID=74557 RepID=A0A1V9Z4Z9_9STRA|nr:phosphatidylinositol-3,4,5-trisphosphate 3-phosphatase [Thraustotheca clavata]
MEIKPSTRSSPPTPVAMLSPNSHTGSFSLSASAPASPASARKPNLMKTSALSLQLKKLVSKKKRRFIDDGFDLDMTYVTSRLIAFGYPAENIEGIYRNHYKDVFNCFEHRHKDHYKVYNLCSERHYDKDKFHNRVAEYPFDDHNPPPLSLLIPACQDIFEWLAGHPDNVAAVHCKAGKGRTGVMICAYLLYSSTWLTSYGAMGFYGGARSLNHQGVTIPSQRRFIEYFATLCHKDQPLEVKHAEMQLSRADFEQLWEKQWHTEETTTDSFTKTSCEKTMSGSDLVALPKIFHRLELPKPVKLRLKNCVIHGIYPKKKLDFRLFVQIGFDKSMIYDLTSLSSTQLSIDETDEEMKLDKLTINYPNDKSPIILQGEVKVELRKRQSGKSIGQIWFHTSFIDTTTLEIHFPKSDIDSLLKDHKKGNKLFAPTMQVVVNFQSI